MNIIDYLTKFIEDCNRGAQKKSIMLTGGRSAKFLYKSFHNLNKNKEIKNTPRIYQYGDASFK